MDNPLQFEDAFSVDGPIGAFYPGFEAPTYGKDGKMDGVVRVERIDYETNTIWLESVKNG